MKIKKIFKFTVSLIICILVILIFFMIMFDSQVITTESINIKELTDNRDSITIPVIMYHSIYSNSNKQNKYIITPHALENDIIYLQKNGYKTVFLIDIINYVKKGTKLPDKPILLTFDDGYYNNYLNAFPLFKKYNECGTISVIGSETEKYTKTIDTHESYANLNWAHIDEMQKSGYVEFLNHSYDMHSLNNGRKGSERKYNESNEEYRRIFTEDATKTQDLFYKNLGFKPVAYTYPFGRISKDSYKCIIDMGFLASLDACDGKFTAKKFDDSCLYRIPRYIRSDTITLKNIIEKHFA